MQHYKNIKPSFEGDNLNALGYMQKRFRKGEFIVSQGIS